MSELSQLYESDIYHTLTVPSYTLAEASRLVGISKGRIARWVRGYEYVYEVSGELREGKQDAVVHRTTNRESTYVSFLDLIDLLFVKRFLDKRFSLQKIRKSLDDARKYLETPHFASSRFFTYGKKIFLDASQAPTGAGNLIALLTGGQQALPHFIEQLSEKIDFEDVTGFGLANRWYPRGKEGHIVIDPLISFGKPTIIDSRLTTSNIYDAYLGENKKIESVTKWFNVPPTKIHSAVNFEISLAA